MKPAVTLALLLASGSRPSLARTTTVPDDFPTIQAALDHLKQFYSPETLLVRAGTYPEQLKVGFAIVLKGVAASAGTEPMPRVDGLTVGWRDGGPFATRFVGLRVAGPVIIGGTNGPAAVTFDQCRFDAGISDVVEALHTDLSTVALTRCTLFGTVTIHAEEMFVDSCTIYGPLILRAPYWGIVRDNLFENVPGTAVTIETRDALVAGNVVRGGIGGFDVRVDQGDIHIADNRIDGCSGDGIRADANYSDKAFVARNRVSHCGGTGISAIGLLQVRNNQVVDCRGLGIDLVQAEFTGSAEGNVVGRCRGDGIRVRGEYSPAPASFSVRNNTVHGCGGFGFVLSDVPEGTVSNNIAFRNVAHGLISVRSEPLALSCNDWFENRAGATSGIEPSSTDLDVEPLFCDLDGDNAHLRSDSPLLGAAGCGLIGALGQGCEPPPVPIAFRFSPQTLNLGSRGRWVIGVLEPAAPFSASDIDVASVRLNGVPVDPAAPSALGDHDRNGIPDLTVRFGRVTVAGTLDDGHVVTVTGLIRGRAFIGTEAVRVTRAVDLAPVENGTSVEAIPAALAIRVASAAAGQMRVEFALPEPGPARLELLDIAGRMIEFAEVGERGPGRHSLELAPQGALRQGIYFLRLRHGVGEARTRVVVVR